MSIIVGFSVFLGIATVYAGPADPDTVGKLSTDLSGNDPKAKLAAVAEIRRLMTLDAEMETANATLREGVGWSMLSAGMYEELLSISEEIMSVSAPYSSRLESMLRFRVEALLASGKIDQALVETKQYYNISRMAGTSDAMSWVAKALAAKYPNDPSMREKFKAQQAAGAVQASATQPVVVDDNVLTTIKVDGKKYEAWMTKKTFAAENWFGYVSRGNLYLLADKPKEALNCFYQSRDSAGAEYQKEMAIEGIAQSMKAMDGNIWRANAWLASQQQKK
jgi:hypothetical protein